jgi:hypothetical protein
MLVAIAPKNDKVLSHAEGSTRPSNARLAHG